MKKGITPPFLLIIIFVFISCEQRTVYEYDDWDANMDQRLDESEFSAAYDENGYYGAWDLNNNDLLEEEEWEDGIVNYYPDYDREIEGDFEDWDLDRDGFIDEDEYLSGSYSLWDSNDDMFVDEAEYKNNFYNL